MLNKHSILKIQSILINKTTYISLGAHAWTSRRPYDGRQKGNGHPQGLEYELGWTYGVRHADGVYDFLKL